LSSHADAVLERLVIRQDKVKPALAGPDDDGAWGFPSVKWDSLAEDWRSDRLQLRIHRVGQYSHRSGAQEETNQDGGAVGWNRPLRDSSAGEQDLAELTEFRDALLRR
jgi:hypothetical protein